MKNILIVGCIHGNERFGHDLIRRIKKSDFANSIDTVIGSPRALHMNMRYIDHDLNRSFGDSAKGYEMQRSEDLKKLMLKHDYVFDMHNTNTSVLNVPIVTNLGMRTRELLKAHPSPRVIYIEEPFASKSLIGYFGDGAVSFEYNRDYASKYGIAEMMQVLSDLTHGVGSFATKEIYYVRDTVPLGIDLGSADSNFVFHKLISGYGILTGENAYVSHQGFRAYKKEVIEL